MSHIFDDAKLTHKQAFILLGLTDTDYLKDNKYRPVSLFEFGGRYFFGDYQALALRFVKTNPTGGDFYVWLQQQEIEVKFH